MTKQTYEPREIHINGRSLQLILKSDRRAKSLKLRCDPFGDKVHLTLPYRANLEDAQKFLDKSQAWLAKQLSKRHLKISFSHGAVIPILGQQYAIHHRATTRPHIEIVDHTLYVEGEENRIHLLIHKWLRFHALGVLQQKSIQLAHKLAVVVNKVRVRELKSLWGSCAADGSLTYSWRLIMAPEAIVEYICAHEVSHIIERNHGKQFWSLVESLCPHFKSSRRWLREEGKNLFLYG